MAETKTYPVELTNGGAQLLRHLLNQSGWTSTITDFICAAQLLTEVVPEPPTSPERPIPTPDSNYAVQFADWKSQNDKWTVAKVAGFTLTEKQRDNVKACLKHAIEKKIIHPSPQAFEVLVKFGVTE